MSLNLWLTDQHAAARPGTPQSGLAANDVFAIVIDELLREDVIAKLQPLFDSEEDWKDSFAVSGARGKVTSKQFDEAEPQRRFFRYRIYDQPKAGDPMTPARFSWIFLQQIFRSRDFIRFVGDTAGANPDTFEGGACHIMTRDSFLRPHSDRGRNRVLCGALYVGDGWRPGYGGEFEMLRDGESVALVDPVPNRLVLFRPDSSVLHTVRAITGAGQNWKRKSISLWWSRSALLPGSQSSHPAA